ncbi:MAG: filamentous hemagglutinin N-terminal domain-containing protein, partial [Symploca sp. SIO2E9]|nr:filamentous hemagglutinin N-terminal domain-containing protein [Symploca sp. SIO2E9]
EAGEVTAESGANGTNTQVNSNGNQFDISGGELSGNNLFHSFEKFGLDANQIANFLSNPDIQNILGRVVGGDVSVIDGLIRVSGGNPNLFLMNPAGIVFGANARLDVPGSFTATTATGIGFDDNFFNAIGSNNYTELVGSPNNFAFAASEPGSIFNAGALEVNNGQNLTLLGGSVISTGSISAEGGQITIAAVAGENRVRISQQGQVLSLELETVGDGETASLTNPLSFNPVSLPQMLTDVEVGDATGVTVNEDGSISLSGSGISFDAETGTVVASGSLDVADTASGSSGGTVAVLGDKVALVGAEIEASGDSGGGIVLVGGDYQGEGKVPNADVTYVSSDSEIAADGLVHGDGGSVIVWADKVTQFFGKISVRGGSEAGNGGLVEVSGKENLIFDGVVDVSASNGSFGTLLLDPTNIIISDEDSTPGVDDALPDIFEDELDGEITINASTLESQIGNVVLEATNDITIADGVSLDFVAGESITFTAEADNAGSGSFSMDPTQSITTNGRELSIDGSTIQVGDISTNGGDITLDGTLILTSDPTLSTGDEFGGNINLEGIVIVSDASSSRNLILKAGEGEVTIKPDMATDIGNVRGINNLEISGKKISVENIRVQTEGDLTLSAENITLTLNNQQLISSGDINLTAMDTLEVSYAPDDPFIVLQADGNLTLQGNNAINIQPESSNTLSWFQSGGDLTLMSNNPITANARFASGGEFSATNLSLSPTNLDGIISSQGDVTFGDYTGPALKVEATGSIRGGNLIITEANTPKNINPNQVIRVEDPDIAILASSPALILRAGLTELQNTPNLPPDQSVDVTTLTSTEAESITTFTSNGLPSLPGSIQVKTINTSVGGDGGPVILSATGDISTGTINSADVDISHEAETGNIKVGDIDGERINISGSEIMTGEISGTNLVKLTSTSGDIIVKTIFAQSSIEITSIEITSAGLFRATDEFNAIVSTESETSITGLEDVPTSIQISSGNFSDRIIIRHGGATGTDNGERILVQGGSEPFVVGPNLGPNIKELPPNVSGARASIIITASGNAAVEKSLQDIAFEPPPEVVIKEPTPEVVIKEPTPEIVIKEPTPEIVIKEPTPEIVIKEPTPEIVAPVTELPPTTETPPTTEQPPPDDQNSDDSENNNQEIASQPFEPEERQANLENSCEDDKNSEQSDQEECEKYQPTSELRLLNLELTNENFTDSTQLEINAQGQLEIKGSGIEIENLDLPANAK